MLLVYPLVHFHDTLQCFLPRNVYAKFIDFIAINNDNVSSLTLVTRQQIPYVLPDIMGNCCGAFDNVSSLGQDYTGANSVCFTKTFVNIRAFPNETPLCKYRRA